MKKVQLILIHIFLILIMLITCFIMTYDIINEVESLWIILLTVPIIDILGIYAIYLCIKNIVNICKKNNKEE